MKAIILAAGKGTRLHPLTEDRPKCLVELGGRSILSYQVETLQACGISDITIVTGYQSHQIEPFGFPTIQNSDYESTNMVASLMCAKSLLVGTADVLIVYGDIIFERKVIDGLLGSDGNISVAVNKNWLPLWKARMNDPLSDAETLKLDQQGFLVELGNKPQSYDEIQGQYMGLIAVKASSVSKLEKMYQSMGSPSSVFMTAFLQHLIHSGWRIKAVPVEGGWLEIDTIQDLDLYSQLLSKGELSRFCKLPVDRSSV